jgi:hypothetical protein
MADLKRGGRPRSIDPATTAIRVRVTDAQRLDLRRVAAENRTNISGVIRQAVNEYVSDYRSRLVFVVRKPDGG